MDEVSGTTAADSVNANNATVSGGTFTAGHINNSLSEDGTNSCAAPSSTPLNMTSAITIAAWVKATTWSGTRRIIQKGDNNNQWSLISNGVNLVFTVAGVASLTGSLPSTGSWHHIAATYGSGFLYLYVDGSQVNSTFGSGAIPTTTDPLRIG